jgi:hypothetical protein
MRNTLLRLCHRLPAITHCVAASLHGLYSCCSAVDCATVARETGHGSNAPETGRQGAAGQERDVSHGALQPSHRRREYCHRVGR